MRLDFIEASGEEMVFGLWSLAVLVMRLDFIEASGEEMVFGCFRMKIRL